MKKHFYPHGCGLSKDDPTPNEGSMNGLMTTDGLNLLEHLWGVLE